jgi:aspergillopepsin I
MVSQLMMQAVWLCVSLFLSFGHAHPAVFGPYSLNSVKRDNAGSFSIAAHRNPHVQRNGPRSKFRALAKYGLPISDALADLASNKGESECRSFPSHTQLFGTDSDRVQVGDVAAYNQSDDREWLSPVSIGTPGQDVLLDFDTGSSDL